MKHTNESIDRLDGDIYEMFNGTMIDMSRIVSVSDLDEKLYPSEWHYYINNSVEISLYGPRGCQESLHKQFIEVWKHWKRENERI